jgi:hypothetical protein
MKNKKVIDVDTGERYDSNLELYFSWYIKELKDKGWIHKIRREKTYELFEPVKYKYLNINNKPLNKTLLHKLTYTDDFGIKWNKEAIDIFVNLINRTPKSKNLPFIGVLDLVNHGEKPLSFIDIKNPFNKQGVKTLFKYKQKWIFQKYGIYIQEVDDIECLFYQTFTPERYFYTDSKKSKRKINYKITSLESYVEVRERMNNDRLKKKD